MCLRPFLRLASNQSAQFKSQLRTIKRIDFLAPHMKFNWPLSSSGAGNCALASALRAHCDAIIAHTHARTPTVALRHARTNTLQYKGCANDSLGTQAAALTTRLALRWARECTLSLRS